MHSSPPAPQLQPADLPPPAPLPCKEYSIALCTRPRNADLRAPASRQSASVYSSATRRAFPPSPPGPDQYQLRRTTPEIASKSDSSTKRVPSGIRLDPFEPCAMKAHIKSRWFVSTTTRPPGRTAPRKLRKTATSSSSAPYPNEVKILHATSKPVSGRGLRRSCLRYRNRSSGNSPRSHSAAASKVSD